MDKPKTQEEKLKGFKVEVIIVQTSNIKVSKKNYSFDYRLMRNSKLVDRGTYDSSHSRSPAYMRKTLKNGYATELVLGMEFA